jgi:hypothetical protein
MKDMGKACIVLVGEPEWKRPVGRSRSSWEDIIKLVCFSVKASGKFL